MDDRGKEIIDFYENGIYLGNNKWYYMMNKDTNQNKALITHIRQLKKVDIESNDFWIENREYIQNDNYPQCSLVFNKKSGKIKL